VSRLCVGGTCLQAALRPSCPAYRCCGVLMMIVGRMGEKGVVLDSDGFLELDGARRPCDPWQNIGGQEKGTCAHLLVWGQCWIAQGRLTFDQVVVFEVLGHHAPHNHWRCFL
jgi:hypothetical protein